MITAFIDASVLFAAALSPTGASREIVRQGVRGHLALIVSDVVLEETKRNLTAKRPDALPALRDLLEAVNFRIEKATKRDVELAAQYTELKDAPMVAAAKKAKVDYLVSLDRRHLVGVPEVSEGSGLMIVLPEELLRQIRAQGE